MENLKERVRGALENFNQLHAGECQAKLVFLQGSQLETSILFPDYPPLNAEDFIEDLSFELENKGVLVQKISHDIEENLIRIKWKVL